MGYLELFLVNYYFYDFEDLPDEIIKILYREDVRKQITNQHDNDDKTQYPCFFDNSMKKLLDKYRLIFYTPSSKHFNIEYILPNGFDVDFIYYYNECKRDVAIVHIDTTKTYLKYLIYYFDSVENFKLVEYDKYDHTYTIFRARKIFQYGLDHNLFDEDNIPFYATTHNDLVLLKTYFNQKDEIPERWINYMCDAAVKYNSIDCLKYLYQKGCILEKHLVCVASSKGYLQCLKYLHENGCMLTSECSYLAHKKNNTDCLDYLLKNGCEHYSLYEKGWGDY